MINIAIFERGETYAHWTTIRDRNDVKVNPTSVKIYIYDPCDYTLVDNQNMTNSSTGVYYYNYDTISSSATYGKYTTKVVATSGASNIGTYISHFYVMPWKVEQSVRYKMGITDEKDIDDDALSEICWMAYQRVLRDAHIHYYGETPSGNPDSGACFDGSNTLFQTNHYPIADIKGDGIVTGTDLGVAGANLCEQDITGWWITSTGSRNALRIVINNANNGVINIYQEGTASAIPSNNEGVYLDYWQQYENFDEFLFREAVSYLAAHYVNLRLTERNKVTLADISKNAPVIMLRPDMYFKEYRSLLKKVSKPKVGGV